MHLVATSSATNTDWFAKIADVSPSGQERSSPKVAAGVATRAGPGSTPEEPLESLARPGRSQAPRVRLPQDRDRANWLHVAKGDRLQIRITSDNLPNGLPGTVYLDPNDPADYSVPLAPAINAVRFGGSDGSFLLLPVFSGS